MLEKRRKTKYPYIIFGICFAVLLWRAFMGFCWTDESFYVSTCDRFYRGAIPLLDEWYRTQLSSVVMLPFYALYVGITGSNTGVILFFRILYLLFSTMVTVVYYRVLVKDYPVRIAFLASLTPMLYAHLSVATFSYYMLSSLFLQLAIIIIYDHKHNDNKILLIVAGVFTALSVMCMPAFAAGYIVAASSALLLLPGMKVFTRITKKELITDRKKLKEILLYTFIGILIPAVIFLVWMFLHMDLKYLVETLPAALVDNEHSNTLGYYIRKPHRSIVEVLGSWTYVYYVLIAGSFIFQEYLYKHPLREVIMLADMVLFCVAAYISRGHTGYIQAVFFMFMLPLFFVSPKKNYRLFFFFVIPAVMVAVIYCFTSSDFLYVMAIGFAIAMPAGICMIGDLMASVDGFLLAELIIPYGPFLVCAFCVAVTFGLRVKNVYRDAPLFELTERIPTGVAAGLYTTDEHLSQYLDISSVIDRYASGKKYFSCISGSANGNVLFSKILPWGYAISGLDCGYPTTWRATAYDEDQLNMYYGMDPMRIPDVIIVLDEEYGSYDAAGDVDDDHNPNLNEMSSYWERYITENSLAAHREKGATVYFKDVREGESN